MTLSQGSMLAALTAASGRPQSVGGGPELAISVADAHFSLRHDRELARALLRIPLPVLYLCCFVAMLFAHVPSESLYAQGSAVFGALATAGADTVTADSPVKFANVQSLGDALDWLELAFAPSVFVTTDYNDAPLTRDQWGRVASFNKVLGAVNFQVTRRASRACDSPPFLQQLYPTCYDPDATETDNTLISFDTNATAAAARLAELRRSGSWLDASAAELLVTVVTYNGELQGYAVTELRLELQQGGGVVSSAATTPALSAPYQATDALVRDVLVLACFLLALGEQARGLRRQWRLRGGLLRTRPDVWALVELASTALVLGFYGVWLSIVALMYAAQFREHLATLVRTGQDWSAGASGAEENKRVLTAVTGSLQRVARLMVALRLVASLAVLALGLRVLQRFRFHPRLSLLTRTMALALHQFASFFVVFVVVFMTFAVSGTVLFGDRVAAFSSLSAAMQTCVNMLFGNFDTDAVGDLYAPVGMLYYWAYMVVVSLVLLNMMLAIVLDAYAEVSQAASQARGNLGAARVLRNAQYALALVLRERGSRRLGQAGSKPIQKVREIEHRAPADGRGAAKPLAYARLGRHDVVFRGRVRPAVLESLTGAMLEAKDDADAHLSLTPRGLVDIFLQAELTEQEARDTIQHLLGGLTQRTEGVQAASIAPAPVRAAAYKDTSASVVEHEEPSEKRSVSPRAVGDQPTHEMLARMAALEQKMDALLSKL